MKEENSATPESKQRISELIGRLRETEQELRTLTGGMVDRIEGGDGNVYLFGEALEKLRHSESIQRQLAETQIAILDALPAQIAVLDERGVILSANQAWKASGGTSGLQGVHCGVGANYLAVCESAQAEGLDYAGQVAAGIQKVLSRKLENFTLEYPSQSPAGQQWLQLMAAPLRAPSGAVLMQIDITARRLTEQSLAQSEERFRLLARATTDAVWDWDLQTDALWWNDGFDTLFGYKRDHTDGDIQAWANRIHPEDKDSVVAGLRRALETGEESWSAEYRFARRDGSYAYVLDRGHVLRDPAGKPVRMIGGMTDLTARKEAEERLAEQAALLDAAREAIYVRDLEGKIIYWNKGAERIYGWNPEEALGRNIVELVHPDLPRFSEAQIALLAKGEWQGEMLKRTKDGREISVEVRWTLVRDTQGKPKSILAINTDITEKKQLETQILRAQRMESIGTLAGGIAHDLNNVLAPILMSVQVLQELVPDPEARALLNTLQTSAQRGADLVKQVLSFARGVEGNRVVISPFHLARDVRKMVQDTFPKNIEFSLDAPGDVWSVEGDPTQLHQVLMNLCVNARDAMTDGGKLRIVFENTTLDEVYSGMNPKSKAGPHVVIRVEDTGTGIPKHIQERIFDPFFTTKEPGKGTGLGLSTALAIVKGHGGFIQVHSKPGQGSKFAVYLPAVTAPAGADGASVDQAKLPHGNGELVLVVDDEEGIRIVSKKTLERFGYRVLLASNGAEAVALYAQRSREIALVLTDMAMPVMDGPSMIIAIRAMNPSVKIVGSSGFGSSNGVSKALESGLQHFVPKPYTAEVLLKTLHQVLHDEVPVS